MNNQNSANQDTAAATLPAAADSILKISLRTAAILLLFTLVFTTFMALIYQATLSPIASSVEAAKLKLISEVLPASEYDNNLLQDTLELGPTRALGLAKPSHVYRARLQGQPSALVFEAAAADGYSGHIGLIMALKANGQLSSVRVTDHKETPGLGDYIELRKDKNKTQPWIRQFDHQSHELRPAERWRVKKDGGDFEQRSGATISARAVVQAVNKALSWAHQHQDELFATAQSLPN